MNASLRAGTGPVRRRGIVLILVLGMLALLALIGVTFATFASQSKIGARNFAQSVNTPDSGDLMDYALSQLINDTNNPLSAIRGHSLKRDMYGSDGNKNGVLRGTVQSYNATSKQVGTDIPYNSRFDYRGWIFKLAPTENGLGPDGSPAVVSGVAKTMQSFVVTGQGQSSPDADGNTFFLFVLSDTDDITKTVNLLSTATTPEESRLIQPSDAVGYQFLLDGRYRYAFNGPGIKDAYAVIDATTKASKNPNPAKYGNYRFNANFLPDLDKDSTKTPAEEAALVDESAVTAIGRGNPSWVGMDEDYDACDLENWFLAIQSADGQVVVPSFHRPGILSQSDWDSSLSISRYAQAIVDGDTDVQKAAAKAMAKILRPRSVDHGPNNSFASGSGGVESPINGQPITFDVDNDADGKTDSVWLDLGYPPRRNANGKLYKPLFAFMVIGLNGRIPLNTAGNLAGSGATHAEHLGNSVSEVDPTYALQNALEDGYGQLDNVNTDVRTVQLQNLLAGTRPVPSGLLTNNRTNPQIVADIGDAPVGTAAFGDLNYVPFGRDPVTGNIIYYCLPNGIADTNAANSKDRDVRGNSPPQVDGDGFYSVQRNAQAIPGRWGEDSAISGLRAPGGSPVAASLMAPYVDRNYNNPVRAGYSLGNRDVNDDNLNSFDPYGNASFTRTGEVGDSDLYDSSNFPMLPVERMRRFVTPVDLNGSGNVEQWNAVGSNTAAGADAFGRVAFVSYFRPPGLPGKINATSGLLSFFTATPSSPTPAVDLTNNPLHGYDFFRFPAKYSSTAGSGPQRLGGMPSNKLAGSSTDVATTGTQIPTYDSNLNGNLRTDGQNDADEMNLYTTSRGDQPFGPSDLEWLYRSQDVDGYSLNSRLSQLAPISFTNQVDGLRRRRLFSIDSWELANYTWANDNPQNLFPNNKIATSQMASTSFDVNSDLVKNGRTALLQGGKKINLNYPLPVSNDPNEPVRRKWITNAYYMLKAILPPKSIDTPEELAQLSQFLVNVIDFRDPDATMTHFTNPDVFLRPGTTGTPGTSPYLVTTKGATDMPVEQYGMEYCPVAINETLAFNFSRKKGTGAAATMQQTGRFYIELVNMLTDSALSPTAGISSYPLDLGGNLFTPSNPSNPWDYGCWDLILTADDAASRPDPFLGQLQNTTQASYYGLLPLTKDIAATTATTNPALPPVPLSATATTSVITSTKLTEFPPTNYLYTIGSQASGTKDESNSYVPTLTLSATYDPIDNKITPPTPPSIGLPPGVLPPMAVSTKAFSKLPLPDEATGQIPKPGTSGGTISTLTQTPYYWVCLRRPANPFAGVSANNPMIIVDCMRFPYINGNGSGAIGKTDSQDKDVVDPKPQNIIYSMQRIQPFRGGHAVQSPEGGFDWRYGYSEQAIGLGVTENPIPATLNNSGMYGTEEITKSVYHSLGYLNDPSKKNDSSKSDGGYVEPRDYFPFNDRDFTSVAELLLVPGCPPGLFTKQFVEMAVAQSHLKYLSLPTNAFAGSVASQTKELSFSYSSISAGSASQPLANYETGISNPVKANPYLVDKFFYSSPNTETTGAAPNSVDSQTSAGWFKMLDFFEVPSQSIGAYGPVAQGANFDWFRQDLKPGLINLNLIIDEEVFLSVLGGRSSGSQVLNFTSQPDGALNVANNVTVNASTGAFVNYSKTPLPNVGHIDAGAQNLKASFVQFLKLRHGGSGTLFGFGSGPVNQGDAVERPFRSLSYPDINQTIMRPASLPPNNPAPPAGTQSTYVASNTSTYSGDPGLKNPLLYPGYTTATVPLTTTRIFPPAIPVRRLFQIPDSSYSLSNASVVGDNFVNTPLLTGSWDVANPPNLINNATTGSSTVELGSHDKNKDSSRHPYFRTEMLQKVMNLTTVRTHQYAVWITVGFFEVTRPGNPDLVDSSPALSYDQLGREIGLNGKIVRYRGFYVVDRTRATGFDPDNPGDFHDCVVYGHAIQ